MILALLLASLALAAPLGEFETRLTASGSADDETFGSSVSPGGDVDGDGFDDVVVGGYTALGLVGAVYLYRGGVDGVFLSTEQVVVPSDGGDAFGYSVAGGADLDGDGFDDLVVGNGSGNGGVYVYPGGASGFDLTREQRLIPDFAGGFFGVVVAMLGDVNADGFDDVAISAPNYRNGSVFVYLGSADGLDPASEVRIEPEVPGCGTACSSLAGGDLNGDGYADLVIGGWNFEYKPGLVRVFFGGPAGIDPASVTTIQPSDPSDTAGFGRSIATGDVDGDSFLDLVVGNFDLNDFAGAAYVFYGSPAGIDLATETVLTASAGQPLEYCGIAVAAVDLDGDTRAEVVMGCSAYGDNTGVVYVYAGTATGVDAASERRLTASDGAPSWSFGYALASARDTNGDGLGDLLVGAPNGDPDGIGYPSGAAYLYSNSPGGACQDADADGACAVDDCDDADPARYPDATDVPGDGIDQDCDGVDATEETDTDTDADADTDTDSDTDTDTDADPGADDSGAAKDSGGCGCASTPAAGAPWLFLLTFLAALRRARSPGASQ